MVSFLDDVTGFISCRQKALLRKTQRIIAWAALAVVLLIAAAIALSKLLSTLLAGLGVAGVAALTFWWLVSSGRLEKLRVFDYIRSALDKLQQLLADKEEELKKAQGGDPAGSSLFELLSLANEQERASLERFVGRSFKEPEQFELLMRRKATHEGNLLWKRISGTEKELALADYSEMLDLAGLAVKVERHSMMDNAYEAEIVRATFNKALASMEDADRRLLEHQMTQYAEAHLGAGVWDVGLATSGVIGANLAGFSTYMMASSLLSGVSSALGLGLGFGAFTGMASTISVIIGPIGWSVLGAWSANRMAGPNKKVTVLSVLSVCSIRARLIYEQQEARRKTVEEVESYRQQQEKLEELLQRATAAPKAKDVFAAIEEETSQAAKKPLALS